MLIIVIITALITSIAIYIDKHLVNKGISRKDYFYYMCLSMIPFSILMIVVDGIRNGIKFELGIMPIILLIVAMFLRYKKQHTIVGCLTHLNPYESSTYMSLGIILAYIIDCMIGVKQFNFISIASITLTLLGVFILADVKLNIKSLQKDLLIRIICEVGLGYVAHYLLKYWSNAIYILLLNLSLTLLFSKGYTWKYHKEHKNIIKWVFIQQSFGFFTVYLGNYLSANSVMLYEFVKPITIVLTILMAYFIKTETKKPKSRDLLAVILVAMGIALLNIIV